jgi:CBS domain-containing protein
VQAATIRPDATLAQANQAMIASGVRLLLVVGLHGVIEGLITARDLMGERSINLLHERGGRHKSLTVADVMTPRSAIDVLEISTVARAEVGDIVATLKDVGRQHALVVDRDPLTHEETLRGIFSATQIGRQLGVPILIFEVAHTFAEIESELAK